LEHLLRTIMDIRKRAFSSADRPQLDHLGRGLSSATSVSGLRRSQQTEPIQYTLHRRKCCL
jgi:hypothetical protein